MRGLKLNIGFEQLLNLADQLSPTDKQRFITVLQKTIKQNKSETGMLATAERQLEKDEGRIQMAEDFNR